MTHPTYDEIRAAAVPCAGGCPVLVTHGRWCHACLRQHRRDMLRRLDALSERFRRGQPDAHGGLE